MALTIATPTTAYAANMAPPKTPTWTAMTWLQKLGDMFNPAGMSQSQALNKYADLAAQYGVPSSISTQVWETGIKPALYAAPPAPPPPTISATLSQGGSWNPTTGLTGANGVAAPYMDAPQPMPSMPKYQTGGDTGNGNLTSLPPVDTSFGSTPPPAFSQPTQAETMRQQGASGAPYTETQQNELANRDTVREKSVDGVIGGPTGETPPPAGPPVISGPALPPAAAAAPPPAATPPPTGDQFNYIPPPANAQMPQLADLYQRMLDQLSGKTQSPLLAPLMADYDRRNVLSADNQEQGMAVRGISNSTLADSARTDRGIAERSGAANLLLDTTSKEFAPELLLANQIYSQDAQTKKDSIQAFMDFLNAQTGLDLTQDNAATRALMLLLNSLGIGTGAVQQPNTTAAPSSQ